MRYPGRWWGPTTLGRPGLVWRPPTRSACGTATTVNSVRPLIYCRQAVALHHAAGDHVGAACALDSLAQVHANLGYHHQSIACYRQALAQFRARPPFPR